jgi:hypothetical protein
MNLLMDADLLKRTQKDRPLTASVSDLVGPLRVTDSPPPEASKPRIRSGQKRTIDVLIHSDK